MATEVLVPPLGQTVDTVTLVTWYKKEGELVAQGDMLFAIETDKATLDVEAPASGVLRQVTAQPGDQGQVLSAIALINAPAEVIAAARIPPVPKPVTPPDVAGTTGQKDDKGRRDRIFISPRARQLAKARHVPLTELQATGPEGAIVERDRGALSAVCPSLARPGSRFCHSGGRIAAATARAGDGWPVGGA